MILAAKRKKCRNHGLPWKLNSATVWMTSLISEIEFSQLFHNSVAPDIFRWVHSGYYRLMNYPGFFQYYVDSTTPRTDLMSLEDTGPFKSVIYYYLWPRLRRTELWVSYDRLAKFQHWISRIQYPICNAASVNLENHFFQTISKLCRWCVCASKLVGCPIVVQSRHLHCAQGTLQLNAQFQSQPTWVFEYQDVGVDGFRSSQSCTNVFAQARTSVNFIISFAKINTRKKCTRFRKSQLKIVMLLLSRKRIIIDWNAEHAQVSKESLDWAVRGPS